MYLYALGEGKASKFIWYKWQVTGRPTVGGVGWPLSIARDRTATIRLLFHNFIRAVKRFIAIIPMKDIANILLNHYKFIRPFYDHSKSELPAQSNTL